MEANCVLVLLHMEFCICFTLLFQYGNSLEICIMGDNDLVNHTLVIESKNKIKSFLNVIKPSSLSIHVVNK